MAEMVRVNTRVSAKVNEWLDEYSEATGMPKSTIIFLAIEQYKRDLEALSSMQNMTAIVEKIDKLQFQLDGTVKRSEV